MSTKTPNKRPSPSEEHQKGAHRTLTPYAATCPEGSGKLQKERTA